MSMDFIKKSKNYIYITGLVVVTSILIRIVYGKDIREIVMGGDLPIVILTGFGYVLFYLLLIVLMLFLPAVIVGIAFILYMIRNKVITRIKASSYKKKKTVTAFVNGMTVVIISIACIALAYNAPILTGSKNCDTYSGTDYSNYYDSNWGQQEQFNKCNDSQYCKVEYTEPYDFYGPSRGARSYRCVPK